MSFKKTYSKEGFNIFFKGNLTNCIRIFPQTDTQLCVFDYSKNKINYIGIKYL